MANEKLTVASPEPITLDDVAEQASQKDSEIPRATPASKNDTAKEIEPNDSKTPSLSSVVVKSGKSSDASDSEDAPPRPQRPLSPTAQIKKDLKDAFPQINEKYIYACLIASGGQPDPAFSALLYLLDPSYESEIGQAPPQPSQQSKAGLTDDELLARQLQKEFDKEERKRRIRASERRKQAVRQEEDHSPDEFEQLKESFSQGFEEAKLTLNSWVLGISRNFSGESKSSDGGSQNPKLFGALGGSSFNKNTQRNTGFDDDPEILSLNFHRSLEMSNPEPLASNKPQPVTKDKKWQPFNSDVPMQSDAFLVADSEDESKDVKKF